ncbi:MAG TPA: metal-dependent hydrolase, partial [Deltaproteobacteria bacterium]|nr:metal-dependent hydrolase [Deltaproteobacteria bacterium]
KFAIAKLDWIRKQRQKMHKKVYQIPDQYLNHEIHYFRGSSYPLRVIENNKSPFAEFVNQEIILNVPAEAQTEMRRSVLN